MISEENEQERDEMNEQGKKEKRKCRGPVTVDPMEKRCVSAHMLAGQRTSTHG